MSFWKKVIALFLVVAVNKPATLSSIYNPDYQQASNAVDNVTVCPTGLSTAHSKSEFRPWIKIDLLDIYDLNSVVIYNRQDDFGKCIYILDHQNHLCVLLQFLGVCRLPSSVMRRLLATACN